MIGQVVRAFARQRDNDLADWIEQQVTFPSTMVDRIVPAMNPQSLDAIAALIQVADPRRGSL